MSSFKINLDKLNNNVDELLKISYDYYSEQEDLYSLLRKVDTSWNDNNTSTFLGVVKSDQTESKNLYNSIRNYCNNITSFESNLTWLLKRCGITNAKTVIYSQDGVSTSIASINNVITNLNSYIRSAQNHLVSCNARREIQSTLNSLNNIKKSLNSIGNNLNNISKGMEDNIINTRRRVHSIQQVIVKPNNLSYNWDTVSLSIHNTNNMETNSQNSGIISPVEETETFSLDIDSEN